METSNFALNGYPRVSTVQKFDARSNGGLQLSLSTVWIHLFNEKRVFWQNFTVLLTFFVKKTYFLTTVHQSEPANWSGLKFLIFWYHGQPFRSKIGGFKTLFNFDGFLTFFSSELWLANLSLIHVEVFCYKLYNVLGKAKNLWFSLPWF